VPPAPPGTLAPRLAEQHPVVVHTYYGSIFKSIYAVA
jgi:hypothetical protein